jgi:hypothetical protein
VILQALHCTTLFANITLNEEYKGIRRETPLKGLPWGHQADPSSRAEIHGYTVASFGVGKNVGIARNAELVLVRLELTWVRQLTYREKLIEAMLLIAANVAIKPKDSAVVNMSFEKRAAAGWAR